MEIRVKLFLGDEFIDPSEYDKVFICCRDVDRIVNDIYERNLRWRDRAENPECEDETETGNSQVGSESAAQVAEAV